METLSETMAATRPSPTPDPSEILEGRQTASRIAEILAFLPANQQEAVRLKFQEQMSYRDIGKVMTLSANHVGVLLHKALKEIRQQHQPKANPGTANPPSHGNRPSPCREQRASPPCAVMKHNGTPRRQEQACRLAALFSADRRPGIMPTRESR